MNWFEIENIAEIDSPSLLLFHERMEHNMVEMLEMVGGDAKRLMPHIKTNKSAKVLQCLMQKGIKKFKAATIAEAELAASQGAEEVLVAHQLVGPKLFRFLKLQRLFPETQFHFLVDDAAHILYCQLVFEREKSTASVFIDVNNGMNRTGASKSQLNELQKIVENAPNLNLAGLHLYDGHHRESNFEEKKQKIQLDLDGISFGDRKVVIGGSPSFSVHSKEERFVCSPGTNVFWDAGYASINPEQNFLPAVVLVARVISKPKEGLITIDAGHKAVAAENPIEKRLVFFNPDVRLLSQSEEHGVLEAKNWNNFKVGDVLYAIPYHVCPTVNLYQELGVVRGNVVKEYWAVEARNRRITC